MQNLLANGAIVEILKITDWLIVARLKTIDDWSVWEWGSFQFADRSGMNLFYGHFGFSHCWSLAE